MSRGTLFIFSGLPGSGKSTLAALLATEAKATYVRIDTIEQGLREDCGIKEIEGKGYCLAYRIAQDNLRRGHFVTADSVNPWDLTRREWSQVAQEVGARFFHIEIVCSDPAEHQHRVETRAATVPGLKLPTWQEVCARDYHPWSGERIRLDTAGKTAGASFIELLSILRDKGAMPG